MIGKLKSITAASNRRSSGEAPQPFRGAAHVELQWSLIGLWAMSLYALVQLRRDQPRPGRLSCAKLLDAFRRMLRDYLHPVQRRATLCRLLRQAVIDDYRRKNKASRDYPRKKRTTPPGAPTILRATAQQVANAAVCEITRR